MENSSAAIVGAGALGGAIGTLLGAKGVPFSSWDRNPERNPQGKSLADTLRSADFALFCIPSWTMRSAVADAIPHLSPNAAVVSFAKGLEPESAKTMSEVLDEAASGVPYAVVGGPMLADEISSGKKAIGIVASRDKRTREHLRDLMTSPAFAMELSDDPFSVSLASVLKNIYAVALGIADGLKFDGNQKGRLTAQALGEMTKIAGILGANAGVMIGTAGAADLIATGYSPFSRNRAVGAEIAELGSCKLESEGVSSVALLMARLGQAAAELPLLNAVKRAAVDCKPASAVFKDYV